MSPDEVDAWRQDCPTKQSKSAVVQNDDESRQYIDRSMVGVCQACEVYGRVDCVI